MMLLATGSSPLKQAMFSKYNPKFVTSSVVAISTRPVFFKVHLSAAAKWSPEKFAVNDTSVPAATVDGVDGTKKTVN